MVQLLQSQLQELSTTGTESEDEEEEEETEQEEDEAKETALANADRIYLGPALEMKEFNTSADSIFKRFLREFDEDEPDYSLVSELRTNYCNWAKSVWAQINEKKVHSTSHYPSL